MYIRSRQLAFSALSFALLSTGMCLGQTTERVSVDSLGAQADYHSYVRDISPDGRYLVFSSPATNLILGDTNGYEDVFVYDRQSGRTEIVSVNSLGGQASGEAPNISGNGRFVTFSTSSFNFIPRHTSYTGSNIYVHDIQSRITEKVNMDSFGVHGSGLCVIAIISEDGRYVAFDSWDSNLVPGDTNSMHDVFVRDRWDGLGANSIYLTGPITSPVMSPVEFTWKAAHGSSKYRLAYSLGANGETFWGHNFDLESPTTVVATGVNTANGLGSYTPPPVPLGFAGQTLYFEIVVEDAAGVLYDSNVLPVIFY